uniref:GATA-type domain-containing protein n=1 Tax=Meloidogyne enterolobii TaxID=390850 RepID=A0A6V7UMP7_MELEN|nr:unnamed protein product [Meloidogyne enterolobii]
MFEVELSNRSKYIPPEQFKKKILIEITNNEIIQNFLPGFEKMVLRNSKFTKNNNCYETSILYKSEKNLSLIEENIENYKNKLLSSYWTEINLIGYKIELLEKQKAEYPKELKSKISDIGSEIRNIIEGNKCNCFNCKITITIQWHRYLKEHYLCNPCLKYKIYNGKMRPEGSHTKMRITKDRKCFTCEATKTSTWYRHSIPEQYLCNSCYKIQQRLKKKTNKIK